MYRMILDGEPHWGPLERLADELRDRGRRLRPDDFMYMGREVDDDGHEIHLYKAVDTRRYLNLDDEGRAYWYVSTPSAGAMELDTPVEYIPVPTVDLAVRWARS